ncbi:MAG TPA: bifunctional UDP-N-acetylglucosamine diphosphorylase/glucosamine-1-phosphate N-acetyltransferase GlmU, partial [Blastocatellia bacterium]|nr:bifunctional UDP-N-acetylglucosamine diphosphorylase/glucosamine-1-phosphate N-acetyltransferase GlmU [Blastocatellia bacterium]
MADVLIMAAGLGTRMKSRRAKVLHEVAGRPLIKHVVRAALGLHPEKLIVVVGHQSGDVERAVREEAAARAERAEYGSDLVFVSQSDQRGTGHAVMSAREVLRDRRGSVVILAGDGPMLKTATLSRLVETHRSEKNDATLLTVCLPDPTGYGRIIRDSEGCFVGTVEQRDASAHQMTIDEVAVSIYCFEIPALLSALEELTTDNAQGEYYLTDVPGIIQGRGGRAGTMLYSDYEEVLGINTRVELAEMERKLRQTKIRELMLAGVTIMDPAATYIQADVEIGPDTVIHPQVIIEGASRIGSGTVIHSWCFLKNADIGDEVIVKNSCVIEDTVIESHASVGPFARLRMQAEIGEEAVIGNFVEVKKSKVGAKSKAQHLAYLGDAAIGERVNIGAGVITCNFD